MCELVHDDVGGVLRKRLALVCLSNIATGCRVHNCREQRSVQEMVASKYKLINTEQEEETPRDYFRSHLRRGEQA